MNRTKGQILIFKTRWPQGRGRLGVEQIRWVGGGENDSMHHRTSWLQDTLSHSVANTHLLHGNSKASLVGGVASFHGVLVKHTQTHPSHGHGFPCLCRIFIHFVVRPFPAPVLGLVESAAGPWHTLYLKRSTHVSPQTVPAHVLTEEIIWQFHTCNLMSCFSWNTSASFLPNTIRNAFDLKQSSMFQPKQFVSWARSMTETWSAFSMRLFSCCFSLHESNLLPFF